MTQPYVPPAGGPPAPGGAPAGTPPQVFTGEMLNMRVAHGDRRFPPELWGRTVGEAMRFYQIMKDDFVSRNQPRPAAPAPAPAAAPPAPTGGYVPPAPAPVAGDREPEDLDERIERIMRRVVGTSPMTREAGNSVKERLRRKYPDWMQHEADIIVELGNGNVPPEMMADEGLWESAYFLVTGRKRAMGQLAAPAAPAPLPPDNGGFLPAAPSPAAPAQSHYPGQPIVTPPPAWFAEASTAPTTGGSGGYNPLTDPQNILMARRFGKPIEEYVQWLNGNVPPMPAARTA